MQTEWMGKYRELIATLYYAANAYSMTCKQPYLGDQVKFSPYEVQIMEVIMENGNTVNNMKWYGSKMGLSQSTFSKYIKQLVSKGLIDRYHIHGNKKDIILKVSDLGLEEYGKYITYIRQKIFDPWFAYLDTMSEQEIDHMNKAIRKWSRQREDQFDTNEVELIKINE